MSSTITNFLAKGEFRKPGTKLVEDARWERVEIDWCTTGWVRQQPGTRVRAVVEKLVSKRNNQTWRWVVGHNGVALDEGSAWSIERALEEANLAFDCQEAASRLSGSAG